MFIQFISKHKGVGAILSVRSTRPVGSFNTRWMGSHSRAVFWCINSEGRQDSPTWTMGQQRLNVGMTNSGWVSACRAISPAMHQRRCVLRGARNASWLAKRMGKRVSHGISFTSVALGEGGGKRSANNANALGHPKKLRSVEQAACKSKRSNGQSLVRWAIHAQSVASMQKTTARMRAPSLRI